MEWNRLRFPQEDTFEELCCQLASSVVDTAGVVFIRKGKPDSGLECFWQLSDGQEWGWQSKWFLTTPTPGQWKQLDKSFETAFKAHPRMTRYYVCLPLDLPDSRRTNTETARQKWEEWVAKWSGYAADRGRVIEFIYWGSHELAKMLTEPAARGMNWYWFNETVLTAEWIIKRASRSVAAAGDRYIPDLNVDTEAKRTFQGFRRTEKYWVGACDCLRELRSHPAPDCSTENSEANEAIAAVAAARNGLLQVFEPVVATGAMSGSSSQVMFLDSNSWHQEAKKTLEALSDARATLDRLQKQALEESGDDPRVASKPFDDQIRTLQKLGAVLSELQGYLRSDEHSAVNAHALILIGEAGSGKTHLLCDLLEEDCHTGRPSLLFHGEHFREGDPWSQMIALVGLSCGRDEFLGALQAAAQAGGGLATIYIDALNEGPGRRIWSMHLASMAEEIKDWPWLRLCVSIRDAFRGQVAPDEATRAYHIVTHNGFVEHTYEASLRFFEHFQLEPSGPLLEPEFDNPLFLMLLCRGLSNSGQTRVPLGLRGFTKVFQFLLHSVNDKLSHEDRLDFDPKEQIVEKAIKVLADAMASRDDECLPRSEAAGLLSDIYAAQGFSRSLLRSLEVESLITIIPDWNGGTGEVVRFTYQRLSDYLVVDGLLNRLDPDDLTRSAQPGGLLHKYVGEETSAWEHAGHIEALAVLLPERFGRELIDISPDALGF